MIYLTSTRFFSRISVFKMNSIPGSGSGSSSSSSPHNPASSSSVTASGRSSEARALASMMEEGISPRVLLNHLAPSIRIPEGADDMMFWRLLVSMIDPPKRKKLQQFNTLDDAINLIKQSKKVVVLSGAGISTSAGLPDFRSRNGIYVQINAEYPDLRDPKSMFDINYFRKNPNPFYQFAKALYPGQYKPTIGHKFIKCLEDHDKLLRNYSQNIDTLENQAGIQRVVECHGSFSKASCTNCKATVNGDEIRDVIFADKVPKCSKCHEQANGPEDGLGLIKPNIVFFGEQLGDEFHNSLEVDKEAIDLLIVIGSSLKVRPVALIPKSIPANVPQILINKEPLDHMEFDIELLGNCDEIIQELCLRLGEGWTHICEPNTSRLNEIINPTSIRKKESEKPRVSNKKDVKTTSCQSECEEPRMIEKKSDADKDNISMCSVHEETGEDLCSFKSNQADAASESIDMIEDLDEVNEDKNELENEKARAISGSETNSSDDWEDIEIVDSSDSFDFDEKADIDIPDSSYIFLMPNRYLFKGAELTNTQIVKYTKETRSFPHSDQSNHQESEQRSITDC